MTKEKSGSVSHMNAYRRYYSTHFGRFQQGDPSDAIGYRGKFGRLLPKDKGCPILEIGSGLGKFAYYLKMEGYEKITCIDVSEELVRLAKEFAGIDVILVEDPIAFLKSRGKAVYDLVFMLDVIEHIGKENIIEYLECVRDVLRPGGWLHITTENMASPVGGRIQQYLDFTHEYNYSEVSLRQVLEIAGFKNVKIWAVRDKIGRTPKSIIYWMLRRIWFLLLGIIYEIERPGLVKPKMFGKELIASASL